MPIPSDTLGFARASLDQIRQTLKEAGWTEEGQTWTKGEAERIDLSRAVQLLKIAEASTIKGWGLVKGKRS